MKRIAFAYFFFTLFVFFSCKENKSNDASSITIIDPFLKDSLSPKLSLKRIVKLEAKDGFPLVNPFRVIEFIDNRFYILDAFRGYYYIFNSEGVFVHAIGKLGSGPGEFTKVFDLDFDEKDSLIVAFAHNDRKFLRFDLEGRFIDEYPIDFFAKELIPVTDGYIFNVDFNSSEISKERNILITDRNGRVKTGFLKYEELDRPSTDFSGFLTKNKDGALYATSLEDTIYQITSNGIYPKYIVDFGAFRVPDKVKIDQTMTGLIDYSLLNRPGFENEQFIFLQFTHKQYLHKLIYNKVSHRSSIDREMEDPILQLLSMPANCFNKEYFISEISFGQWFYFNQEKKNKIAELYPDLFELLKDFKEEDNSILVFYTIS